MDTENITLCRGAKEEREIRMKKKVTVLAIAAHHIFMQLFWQTIKRCVKTVLN